MAIAMTLNSQPSTFNHFVVTGVCREFHLSLTGLSAGPNLPSL